MADNGRARISTAAGLTQAQVTAFHPMVNVTAQGCSFVNLGTFYGFDGTRCSNAVLDPVPGEPWARADDIVAGLRRIVGCVEWPRTHS